MTWYVTVGVATRQTDRVSGRFTCSCRGKTPGMTRWKSDARLKWSSFRSYESSCAMLSAFRFLFSTLFLHKNTSHPRMMPKNMKFRQILDNIQLQFRGLEGEQVRQGHFNDFMLIGCSRPVACGGARGAGPPCVLPGPPAFFCGGLSSTLGPPMDRAGPAAKFSRYGAGLFGSPGKFWPIRRLFLLRCIISIGWR